VTGQGTTRRHSRLRCLLTAVALIAVSALWSPPHAASAVDLAGSRSGALATGIALGAPASGIRHDTRLTGGRHKVVPLGQGVGLAVAGLLFLLARPYHGPLPASAGDGWPARDKASRRRRDRAPPRLGNDR
jgi:hypothetical protein